MSYLQGLRCAKHRNVALAGRFDWTEPDLTTMYVDPCRECAQERNEPDEGPHDTADTDYRETLEAARACKGGAA